MSSNTNLVLTALHEDTDGVCNVRLYIELAGRHGTFGHMHMTKDTKHASKHQRGTLRRFYGEMRVDSVCAPPSLNQ